MQLRDGQNRKTCCYKPSAEERSSVAGQRQTASGQQQIRVDLGRPALVHGQIGQVARVTF